MSTLLARLWSHSPTPSPGRRKVARRTSSAEAVATSMQGDTAKGVLADVSTNGCSLVSDAEWLRAGRFVSIAIENDKPIQAIIRWVRDGRAGMEFLRPVTPDNPEWLALMD